jgi:aminoglycoside phosphotransferase (APT) family kinase protein
MSVRLPSGDAYVPQIDKEHRWLPELQRHLPLQIPEPLAKGRPDGAFPRPWSVYKWIDGETAGDDTVSDNRRLAEDLAGFLCALYRCDVPDEAPAGSFTRGGPVDVWDDQTRGALDRLEGVVDSEGAAEVWEAAVAAPPWYPHDPVWVHGDVVGTNLLVREGRLHAVIDFGCATVGDPACDAPIAWNYFGGDSREAFMAALPFDDATWARGRGWALWKAVIELAMDQISPGHATRAARRMGWRRSAQEVVDEVVADHRRSG